MKQWLTLTGVVTLFLLVWGTVIFQIFLKEEASVKVSSDLPTIREQYESVIKNFNNIETKTTKNNEAIVIVSKKYTNKNLQTNPQIDKGLGFGEGISVDDLLESFGVNKNSN